MFTIQKTFFILHQIKKLIVEGEDTGGVGGRKGVTILIRILKRKDQYCFSHNIQSTHGQTSIE